ncbi:MAG: LutC/YkgG family protein [Solirubrobacteraceae bacterium]
MSDDRDLILGRIRAALADVPPAESAAWSLDAEPDDPGVRYGRGLAATAHEQVALFDERCSDYHATVTRCGSAAAEISATVAAICTRQGAAKLIAPEDIPSGWLPEIVEVDRDDGSLAAGELTHYDGTLTGCSLAIALTGTIVLDAGAGQGRRLLSLVPDLHICVVRADQVVGSVPEAVALMGDSARQRRPLTLISGPSATSDIELVRVEGVHGPRRLEVVLAGDGAS